MCPSAVKSRFVHSITIVAQQKEYSHRTSHLCAVQSLLIHSKEHIVEPEYQCWPWANVASSVSLKDSGISYPGISIGCRPSVILTGPGNPPRVPVLLPKKLSGVCGTLLPILSLFFCFPYPISEPTQTWTPSFRPGSKMNTLYKTCLIISCLV